MIEEALRAILIADSPVNTVVSGRIYPIRTPDNVTFPCISYTRVSMDREPVMEGPGNLTFSNFQIDIWGPKQSAVSGGTGGNTIVRDLARKIQAALDGYRGTVSGVDIQGILSQNESQSWESDIEVYRVIQQWLVIHREG